MSIVNEFATFLNEMEPMVDRRKWKGIHVDALDKLFHKGVYRGHVEFGELVLPSTLDTGTTSMLLRMWGGFRMLKDIAGCRIVPRSDGAFFEWLDPSEVGVATADPLPVENPEGIRAETKIDEFVRRLNDGSRSLPSGPFTSTPWCDNHNIYSGERLVGTINKDNCLTISPDVGLGAAEWLRETWRSLEAPSASDWTTWRSPDAPPAIPLRVQRFLDALRFTFRGPHGEIIGAPFTVKHYPKEGLIELSGNSVQFGTVRGDRFSPYEQLIGEKASMFLERIWDETHTSREQDLFNKIATLEAELAAKTARLDQIAALLKANP